MTGFRPTPGVEAIALAKVKGREEAFIADVAGGRGRTLISKTFSLSWEQYEVLVRHFAERISAWRSLRGPPWIERSLPTGDRE